MADPCSAKPWLKFYEAHVPPNLEYPNICMRKSPLTKSPGVIEFMDELPTSPVGKVLKRELRKEMQAE